MSQQARKPSESSGTQNYRLWIAGCGAWQPERWSDVPPEAVTIEPVDEGCCSAEQAAAFVEGFNSQMLIEPQGRWAIAVPVTIRYEGDVAAGRRIAWPQMARCLALESAAAG